MPEVKALQQLKRKGLVEITEGDEPVFEYRALTQCVLTPAKPQGVRAILSARQKELLLWLTEAGLRLSTAELVFLTEHHVAPQINLLGDRNRQNLTETIYTQETIFDNILEAQMEHAAVRDEVVSALLRLLKKRESFCCEVRNERKIRKIPPPLQKQIIMRCGAALVSLLLMVVSLLLEGNLYLSLSVLLFFAFLWIQCITTVV